MRAAILVASITFTGPLQAALIDRGSGLIYDTDLDITWMQDVNYVSTLGWPSWGNGRVSHSSAVQFVDQLDFGGFTNWRLPTGQVMDSTCNENFIASYDHGFNCSGGELGHLYFEELGNLAADDENGNPRQNVGMENLGPFTNFPDGVDSYWTSTFLPGHSDTVFIFDIHNGNSDLSLDYNRHRVWAVHDGDIASVPEPPALVLLSTGLIGLLAIRLRRPGRRFRFIDS